MIEIISLTPTSLRYVMEKNCEIKKRENKRKIMRMIRGLRYVMEKNCEIKKRENKRKIMRMIRERESERKRYRKKKTKKE